MENSIQKTSTELAEWWDVISTKALLDLDNVKVDIFEMLAMLDCLNELDLLRADDEAELES